MRLCLRSEPGRSAGASGKQTPRPSQLAPTPHAIPLDDTDDADDDGNGEQQYFIGADAPSSEEDDYEPSTRPSLQDSDLVDFPDLVMAEAAFFGAGENETEDDEDDPFGWGVQMA